MITSSRSPTSVTAATRSSSPHGESSELTRVHSWVSGVVPGLADLDQPGAGVLLLGRRHGVLEVGQQHVDGRRDASAPWRPSSGCDAGRKWITRDGRNGISRTGSGAPIASGRKKSFGGRTHGRLRDARLPWPCPPSGRASPPLWVYLFGLFAVADRPALAGPAGRAQRRVQRGVASPSRRRSSVIVVLTVAPARSLVRADRLHGRWMRSPVRTTRRSATRPSTMRAGTRRPGGHRRAAPAARRRGPGGRCPRTAPGGCSRRPSRRPGPAPAARHLAKRTTSRAGTRRSAAPAGTPSRRGPSAPGSRPTRRRRGTSASATAWTAAPSAVVRLSGPARGRCSCRRRRRRARRRTPARPAPCTARCPGRASSASRSSGT